MTEQERELQRDDERWLPAMCYADEHAGDEVTVGASEPPMAIDFELLQHTKRALDMVYEAMFGKGAA